MYISLDLTRHSCSAYAYTYDNPASVGPKAPLQLEFWVPKGRKGGSWVAGEHDENHYRAWRKVRQFHQHADKLSHSIAGVKPRGYARAVDYKVKEYLEWARARGLTRVHSFTGCKIAPKWAPAGLELVPVDPAEFIGPAPIAEVCDE